MLESGEGGGGRIGGRRLFFIIILYIMYTRIHKRVENGKFSHFPAPANVWKADLSLGLGQAEEGPFAYFFRLLLKVAVVFLTSFICVFHF